MPNILVVDDSKTVRNMVRHLLSDTGATVTLARDGAEGYEAVSQGTFDLIITDVKMPRMDGFQLCGRINGSRPTATPVLIMSADINDRDVENGFLAGAWGHITKHNIKQELLPRVQEILHRKNLARNWRFLIVDASARIRTHLKATLPALGVRAVAANTGESALTLLKRHRPDFIFVDAHLPDMEGEAFSRAVRSMPGMRNVPLVVMSHGGSPSAMQAAIDGWASAHLLKPFNPSQLVLLAQRLLMDERTVLVRENRELNNEFNAMHSGMAEMIRILEGRDPFTRGHSDEVAELSVNIGKQLGLSPNELDRLSLAARLHDIGKISIRDSILLKPESLADHEQEAIRHHPEAGAQLLQPLARLEDVVPAVQQHHERFDGNGYPAGLKGNSISLMARIISVGDAYQAMTSERPYRKARTDSEALEIMREALGTQFCPTCGRAFLEHMDRTRRVETATQAVENLTRSVKRRKQAPIVGKTIMVADSNRMMVKSLSAELRDRGASKLISATSADEIWESLNKHVPDLFICEWEMPGIRLREIMEKMAWSESLSETKTIVMTRGEDRNILNEIISFQPSCILKKPFALEEMCSHAARVLASRDPQDAEQHDDPCSMGCISDVPSLMKKLHSNMAVEVREFSNEITDRYRSYFCRFFTVYNLPVPVNDIQQAHRDFKDNVIGRHMAECQKKIREMEDKLDSGAGSIKEIIAGSVTCAMNMLGELLDEAVYHFRDRLLDCLEEQASKYADAKEVAWVVDEYRVDITFRVNNRSETIMAILNENLQAYQDILGEGYKHYVHSLVDAFGRGLLEPIDEFYPITTDIKGPASRQRCFPRELCRPLLSTLRDFIVGKNKYDAANEKILRSVRKYFGHKFGFDRNRLGQYYTHPKVRQYLVSHILNCLKIMSSELKLENFMRMVNERARQAQVSPEIRFEEAQWRMLSSAWRKFASHNLGEHQKNSRAVKAILEGSMQAEAAQ